MTKEGPLSIGQALVWTERYLSQKGDEHPRLSAQWLLSSACGLSRVELYAYYDRELTADERAVMREAVIRRGKGEPLQYVTGEVAFRHIVVNVERGVLIPRPETEVLVEEGLSALDASVVHGGASRVLDLCCGSGVVGLSVAHERGCSVVVATDIDPTATALTQRNADALFLSDRVTVLEGDLFDALDAYGPTVLPDVWEGGFDHAFDLVISNPPYIPTEELASLPAEVADFEPRLALDGGPDGLDVFRRIASQATRFLKPGGTLACELHEDMLGKAAAGCAEWYRDTRIVKDLTGRDRVLVARTAEVQVI